MCGNCQSVLSCSTVLRKCSGFGQTLSVVTKWVVEFRTQWVRWKGTFELLQGAVDRTTTLYKLILQKVQVTWNQTQENNSLSDKDTLTDSHPLPGRCMTPLQRPLWSVGVGAVPEWYRQRMEAISCQKPQKPSDRESTWCRVQSTKTTSCLREDFNSWSFKNQTQSSLCEKRVRPSQRVQPVWLRWGAL